MKGQHNQMKVTNLVKTNSIQSFQRLAHICAKQVHKCWHLLKFSVWLTAHLESFMFSSIVCVDLAMYKIFLEDFL